MAGHYGLTFFIVFGSTSGISGFCPMTDRYIWLCGQYESQLAVLHGS